MFEPRQRRATWSAFGPHMCAASGVCTAPSPTAAETVATSTHLL
jgi:hypothetical protein